MRAPAPIEDDNLALPHAAHQRIVHTLYAYLGIATGYFGIFTLIYLFGLHLMWLGIIDATFTLLALLLLAHMMTTKTTRLASFGICTLAAAIVTILALSGSAGDSGTYAVFGGSIFLFFMPHRRYYVFLLSTMLVIFVTAFALKLTGFISLPYSNGNFASFIISFVADNTLLLLYGREKAKVDHELHQSLKEIRVLADRLGQEKATIEEQVRERTHAYREEHVKLKASIDSLPIGFLLLDNHGGIVTVNHAGRHILGELWTHKMARPELTMADIMIRLNGAYDLEGKAIDAIRRKKATIANDVVVDNHFLTFSITPVLDGAIPVGAVVLVEDTTNSKALERSRDEFLSIVSHELRTPLTSIVGNASMLAQYYGQYDEKVFKEFVGDITISAKRLINIVSDFLDTSRLEQGKMSMQLSAVDPISITQQVITELKPLSKQKALHIRLVQASDPMPHLIADPDRLKQILVNLIANAIHYTDHGEITITIDHTARQAIISVQDTGKGIVSGAQYLLFRKFQQASDDILTRDNSQSTGLGLYVSRMLAQAMKGDVYLKYSAPGLGSTFVVTLPIEHT